MRKLVFTTTAIVSLALAPAVWAQHKGEGGGMAPEAGTAPGGAGAQSSPGESRGEMNRGGEPKARGEMHGEQGQKMREGGEQGGKARGENAQEERGERSGGKAQMNERGEHSGKAQGEHGEQSGKAHSERGERGEHVDQGGKMDQNGRAEQGEHGGKSVTDRERGEGGQMHEGARSSSGGSAASLSSEQKTRVRSGFHGVNVREARDINISTVRVGANIPHNVVEYWEPVPSSIVEVVPEWRSYKVVRIHGDIIVIDPDTFEIVYVFS